MLTTDLSQLAALAQVPVAPRADECDNHDVDSGAATTIRLDRYMGRIVALICDDETALQVGGIHEVVPAPSLASGSGARRGMRVPANTYVYVLVTPRRSKLTIIAASDNATLNRAPITVSRAELARELEGGP